MVDFSKLVGKKLALDVADPLKLFESLDRKASHTNLRQPQIQVLEALRSRRQERDLVLKMPTGTGKSTVALLFLKSHAAEKKRPAVYLCPTTQLVEQVLEEAGKLGIAAHYYPPGEPHPNAQCITGEAITVCSYSKLFNARSTFDRPDVSLRPCALVLDDAHTGIEEVRESFTLTLKDEARVREILKLLDGSCRQYAPGLWQDVKNGYPDAIIEIPYWIWASVAGPVRELLAPHAEEDELKWVWPYLRDHLRWCRCIVAADGVEIVPHILPVRSVRAYEVADHRLFMSATLADDALLVRELGCNPQAAATPIVAGADAGLGERMVLAPSLLDPGLERSWVMKWCQMMARRVRVVVLAASERLARHWQSYGATCVVGADVSRAVTDLKAGRLSFVAFTQRYDGVDLPDDACRILVLDGMPYGQRIVDRYDGQRMDTPGGTRNRLVYRIEQGMGRAVRSQADYAVVVLAGPELASFTSKLEVREAMSPDARAQLELAHELAAIAREEAGSPAAVLEDMVRKCLNRDPGWKSFYDEKVRGALGTITSSSNSDAIELADAERSAAMAAMDGDTPRAVKLLTAAVDKRQWASERVKARYLQQLANYKHDLNPAEAVGLQKAAFEKNQYMHRPPIGVTTRPRDPGKVDAQARVLRWYTGFSNPNGVIAEFQRIRNDLVFGPGTRKFEAALKDLAPFLGAEGNRPEDELGAGPDNLILWPELSLVIEAKTNANYTEIPKKDAEQLLHSVEWFRNSYPMRTPTPVLVARTSTVEANVFLPEGTRIITPDLLDALITAVDRFLVALVAKVPNAWTLAEIAALQTDHGLAQAQFVGRFTVPIR